MRLFIALLSRSLIVIGLATWAGRAAAEDKATAGVYAEPLPQHWLAPVYPPEALKAGAEGRVLVEFVVDAEGRVVEPKTRVDKKKPVDPRLEAAVLAAARQWTFSPALNDGKPEPRALRVAVGFYLKGRGGKPSVDLPREPDTVPTKPARVTAQPDPVYPDELLLRKLPGTVEFEFQVSTAGQVENVKVLFASDAGFVVPGLATLNRWSFEPGRQGPLAVVTAKTSPMEFLVEGDNTRPVDILAANGIVGVQAAEGEVVPVPLCLFAPVYPRPRLEAGETGAAEVQFVIKENGLTGDITVITASQPEFAAALVAAVETWQFRPAIKGGSRTQVTVQARQAFALRETDAEVRLLAALKTGIAGAGGLDRSLRPLWRVAPRYPAELMGEKPAGEAVIEFIIDREGRCRLPRVTTATHAAFGWAAATAISQWVFEPPLRRGEPTEVRVSIPITFVAPAQ